MNTAKKFGRMALGCSVLCLAACTSAGGPRQVPPAQTIYYNARFVTMDPRQPTAEAVAVVDGTITQVGRSFQVLERRGRDTKMIDLQGATVFPGFIDTHSHLMGYAIFNDPEHWLDVSNVNLLFKPAPGDPRCTDPKNPQVCFIPVTNEDEVLARIAAAVAKDPTNSTAPVLAFGHDVARLGSSAGCDGFGFACPNLQDGHAREMLDAISKTRPIYVSATSGHFGYANTPALQLLNICGTLYETDKNTCHPPIADAQNEAAQADEGELVEDLALYAPSFFEGPIFKENPADLAKLLDKSVLIYRQHGFTTVQEGATSSGQLAIYDLVTRDPEFPVTVAILAYAGTPKFEDSVEIARKAKKDHENDPNLIVAGVKTYADGSTQGYSAHLRDQYFQVYPPLMQPWFGSSDHDTTQLTFEAVTAHAAGFPLAIHMNGDYAIGAALQVLKDHHDPKIHDLVIHAQVSDLATFARIKELGAGLTFLIPDLYYYGLPFRQQILGCERGSKVFPLGDAVRTGVPFGLHSDSPVTPPDPLFMIWAAKTRSSQQPPWLPELPLSPCPPDTGKEQIISIAQGVRAFTVDAAAFYGLESRMGSLTVGKVGDMTILSEDPLSMETKPDGLKNIRVLGTVHQGRYFPNPDASQHPIWPG